MIIRKSPSELAIMARGGAIIARMHEEVGAHVRPGVSTAELDALAETFIRGHGAVPSFKGYGGGQGTQAPFPGTLCTSVNDQIVHGIPSRDVVLVEGDLLKIDAGCILDGYHSDSAATWIVGGEEAAPPEVAELVRVTREGLWAGLMQSRRGNRVGDVSAAVQVVGDRHGYGIVEHYVGHGVGRSLHEDPQVPNHGRPRRGPRLERGLVIAIEPMFNLGTKETAVLDDDWTVVTADGRLSAHWEHTVAVTDDGPWVLTARSDEPAWPLAQPERIPVPLRVA